MIGALEARADRFRAERDLALMNAYISGRLATADWQKMPPFDRWKRDLTEGRRRTSDAELIARFEAWARRGAPQPESEGK